MNDIPYGRQLIDEEDVAAVTSVLRSDLLTGGPRLIEFEKALADVTGAPTVAVNSGTAALHAAYAAAGVGPGTEVVTSPLTFVATASVAIHLGATVKFADVTDDTLTLDPDAAEEACTHRTRVVTAVDFAGHPSDFKPLREVADRREASFIVDAAHSLGASYEGKAVGEWSDLATFSFHPVKTITTGEGGAVAARDPELRYSVELFRSHGLVRERERMRLQDQGRWHQEVHAFGLNYRIPDIVAALGTSQLRKLGAFLARRSYLFERYQRLLGDVDGIRLPTTRSNVNPAWHLFAVRILNGRRREVYDTLNSVGIRVQVHYMPAHLHPAFLDRGYRKGMFPVAEAAYDELMSLPLFPALTDVQQDRVVAEVRTALGA